MLSSLRQQKIELMSDHQLAYVILHTVFAHSVKWDQTRKMYRLYMEGFEDLFLFQVEIMHLIIKFTMACYKGFMIFYCISKGFYWDARNVLVSEDGEKIVIQMANGEEYHSDCDKRLRPTYELAKLHVQVSPVLFQNYIITQQLIWMRFQFTAEYVVSVYSSRCAFPTSLPVSPTTTFTSFSRAQ